MNYEDLVRENELLRSRVNELEDLQLRLSKTEEALRENEEAFRSIFANSPDGILLTAPDGRVIKANQAACRMLGRTEAELCAVGRDAVLDHTDPRLGPAFEERARTGLFRGELNLKRKDGAVFPAEVSSSVFTSSDGGLRTSTIVRDLTEKRAEDANFRESEERFRRLFDQAPIGVAIVSLDYRFIRVNEALTRMTGYTAEELTSMGFPAITHPDDLAEDLAQAARLEAGEIDGYVMEKRYRCKDGAWMWAHLSGRIVRDDKGSPLHFIAMLEDITDRKKAERRIAGQQAQMKLAQDMARIGYWTYDIATGMPEWSEMMFEVLGWDRGKGVPHYDAHRDFIHPEDWDTFDTAMQRAVQGIPYVLDLRIVFPDGSIHYVTAQGHPRRDEEGVIRSLFGVTQDITHRIAAEEDLKQSRQAFTNIVERSADGILVLDAHGNVLYANHSATLLLGQDQDSLRKAPFGTPTTIQEVATIHIVRSDGEIREVELRAAPTDWFGQPARIVMLRDMTERGQHEAALRKEKEKTEQYLNVAGVMFVVLDCNGRVVTVNRKTCEVLGRERDELVGRDWFSTALPENVEDEVRRMFDHLMEGRLDPYEYVEAPILRANGDMRLISWRNSLLKDEKGTVVGSVSSGDDITERREMETLLAESEERYRVLFERSSEAIFIAGREGDILTANQATAELFEVEAAELKHLNITDFYQNPDDRIAFRREVESKGFVKDYPLRMKRKDGTEKLCVLSSSLWKDREGAIIGYLSMLLDVTEHRRLEEQLLQAQKMESIGTLAGGVAHDFNNILTIIQGYSEMVLMDKSQEHPDYADLSAVYDAAKRGADLVKQLMTFSRKVETDMRPVNLNNEVQTAVKLLSRTIPKMIDVQMRLAPDTRRIKADSGQIEQVILNLAVNAKHAMPDGGTLTIETGNITLDDAYCKTHAEAAPGEYVYLVIEDTGYGMSKEVVNRIFEPFFSTKKQGEGTGLGLAMVYGIVKHHGGHILCYSEPGVGTTFKIYLPVIEDVDQSGEWEVPPEAPGGSETVLLVDDEEMIRSLGRKMLEQAGYRVLEALTGEEAVEIYGKEGSRIDLVVLDLIMPGMGGRQALTELKNMDPDVRVIIASGYSPDGPAKSAIESGAAGFITKPFRRHDVLRTVREVLDR